MSLAGIASFLFINHEILYLNGPFALSRAPIESYFLATIVIYLFLRMLIIAAEMRPTRAGSLLCPECGQRLDGLTVEGREAHRRIELTPQPPEKEVVSAVALRKAVGAAHLSSRASKALSQRGIAAPRDLENITGHDLVAAIDDPELLERLLHGPNPPRDPRLKR